MNEKVLVSTTLKDLCVPANVLGFEYLRTAILECLEDKTLIHNITGKMYPLIAMKHFTTASRVERSIRHAIKLSCEVVPDGILRKYVSIHRKKKILTNGTFIASIVDSIRLESEREFQHYKI